MVVLLRSAGLPARIVNGFAGGHSNALGDFLEVAQSDAHSWVEVPFHERGLGALRSRRRPTCASRAPTRCASTAGWTELASALELWWFRNVVDFDRGHQARAVRSVWIAWHRWRKGEAPADTLDEEDPFSLTIPTAPLWGAALLVLLGGALAADLRRRRGRRRQRLPAAYARALRLLGRRGHVRGEAETARGFALALAGRISPPAAESFRRLTDAYLAERFGGAPAAAEQAELRILRDSLRR